MNFYCEIGITVKNIFELPLPLKIPSYQRPYKWTEKNISELFFDILKAKKENDKRKLDGKPLRESYRIGTIILHEETDKYNIVDGQQRIISLCLLLKILGNPIDLDVIDDSAGITKYNIHKNYAKLKNLVKSELSNEEDKKYYLEYIQNECEFVKIVTDSQELAFQFFDSQNNRGKELELYDILKAYHLRNISASYSDINMAVENWEKAELTLSRLFNDSLYQIKQWSKSKNGNRSKWKMDDKDRFFEIFKGIRNNNDAENDNDDGYPFKKYHLSTRRKYRQIDMPIISGEYFFEDIFYYLNLYSEIEDLCEERFRTILEDFIKPKKSEEEKTFIFKNVGDKYIYDMMKCALLFLAVKFGKENIKKDNIAEKIFAWAWILKLYYSKISKETINNYAICKEPRINRDLKLFEIISDKIEIKHILEVELQKPEPKVRNEKNEKMYNTIISYMGT
jgi:hypothetical protein